MESKHYLLIVAFLTGLGTAISGLHDWRDALAPLFIGGAMVQIASLIGALFTTAATSMLPPGSDD